LMRDPSDDDEDFGEEWENNNNNNNLHTFNFLLIWPRSGSMLFPHFYFVFLWYFSLCMRVSLSVLRLKFLLLGKNLNDFRLSFVPLYWVFYVLTISPSYRACLFVCWCVWVN
jgi:hypothetical protein